MIIRSKYFMRLPNIAISGFVWIILCAACVDIEGPEMEPLAPGDVLSRVEISSSAIMIAKGDSHKIALNIYAMNGEPVPYYPDSIRWSSSEAKVVAVSPHGTVYGLKVSDGAVRVIATFRYRYVTRSDTVSVYVTDTVIDANAVRLVSLDSNRVDMYSPFGYPRVRVDLYKNEVLREKGALIPIQVDQPAGSIIDRTGGADGEPVYRITNPKSLIGKFWVRASINMYGNEVNDSLEYVGLYRSSLNLPNVQTLDANQSAMVTNLDTVPVYTYQPCAFAFVANYSADTIDVIFSDSLTSSASCSPSPLHPLLVFSVINSNLHGQFVGGNVMSMPPSSVATRQSNTQGVVTYRVRKSATKEFIPFFTGHFKQLNPES